MLTYHAWLTTMHNADSNILHRHEKHSFVHFCILLLVNCVHANKYSGNRRSFCL